MLMRLRTFPHFADEIIVLDKGVFGVNSIILSILDASIGTSGVRGAAKSRLIFLKKHWAVRRAIRLPRAVRKFQASAKHFQAAVLSRHPPQVERVENCEFCLPSPSIPRRLVHLSPFRYRRLFSLVSPVWDLEDVAG